MRSQWSGFLGLALLVTLFASLWTLIFGLAPPKASQMSQAPQMSQSPPKSQANVLNLSDVAVKPESLDYFRKSLIGLTFSDKDTLDPMKICRERLPAKTRVIPKGGFVTMDYVEDRLNLKLDSKLKVENVTIG